MKKKWIRIVELCLVLTLLAGGFMIVHQIREDRSAAQSSLRAAAIAGLPTAGESEPPASPQTAADPESAPAPEDPPEEVPLSGIDLAALQEVNGDVVGWIEVPGTELSYPLLQGEDNRYYLNRSWEKERNRGGSVFMECTNSRDLTDYHTILYAHRMRNDSMFGTLKYYRDPDYVREHPSVYIASSDGVYRYDVFAAYEAWVRDILYRSDLEESGLEAEFLDYCVASSEIAPGVTPEEGERILTLSTCTGDGHATRWVVQAVLRETWPAE